MEKLYELHQRHRLRPRRRRHAADPQRPRLPRRPPPADPLPRPPALPHAHGAEPRRDEGGERGRPGVPAHGRQGGGRRGDRRRHRLLPGLRGHGGGLPRAGRRGAAAAARPTRRRSCSWPRPRRDTVEEAQFFAAQARARPTSPVRALDREPHAPDASATGWPRRRAERAATLDGTDLGGLYRNLADFQLVAVARGAPPRRPGRRRWRPRRWCGCRSCRPTSTTSTASPTLGAA